MVSALIEALVSEPWTTVAPAEQRQSDIELGAPSFDHDDPTTNLPTEPDPKIAAEAELARAAQRAPAASA